MARIASSELTVPKEVQGVEYMLAGNILVINNQLDKALIIEDYTTSLDNQYVNFNLLPLKGMLNYRICHPKDVSSYLQLTQGEVMKLLVWNNVIKNTRDDDRIFWSTGRTKNLLGVAAIAALGDIVDFTVDWETGYLGDALTTVAKMYGKNALYPLGWNVYIKSNYSMLELEVYEGRQKHINQTINAPVVFSEEFGNIANATYTYSIKEWRNVAYMIYENANKEEIEKAVGNYTKGWTEGFNRKEIIFNSSAETDKEVGDEGYSELNKRPHIESFTADIINNPNTMSTYKKDFE